MNTETDKYLQELCKLWEAKLSKLEKQNGILREMLVQEYGHCKECIDARLSGATICGDCYCNG